MNKKNKNDLYESKWEIFLRNYRNVPGFKALVKLGGYFLFFLIFILIVSFGTNSLKEDNNNPSESNAKTTEEASKKYKDILADLATNNSNIDLLYTVNANKNKISAVFENNIIIGTLENESGIKRFKIQDSMVYEVLLENETLNPELFGGLNINFLIPNNLVNILNENQATKRIEDEKVIYSYVINYNNINYNIVVSVVKEAVTAIELTSENEVYSISYK